MDPEIIHTLSAQDSHSSAARLFLNDYTHLSTSSPASPRLFGTKASSKASSPGTPDSGKCPSLLGSPHGTLARQASLDSPSSGTGSLGSCGGTSGGSSPLYGKAPDLCADSPASSPASGLSLPSNARPWPACSSSAGSKDTLSCQSMTSLHTSSESIDLPLGHHGPKVTRTGSVKSTLSEGWVRGIRWVLNRIHCFIWEQRQIACVPHPSPSHRSMQKHFGSIEEEKRNGRQEERY